MCCERGQASVEWTGLVLLVALVFGALLTVVPAVDGRSYGSYLAHSILCSMRGGCASDDPALPRADGGGGRAVLQRVAPKIAYGPGAPSPPADLPPFPPPGR